MALASLLTIVVTPVPAQTPPGTLPSDVVAILDRNYLGWALIDNFSMIRESWKLDTTQSHPNLVWGDFNGDGRRDYAVFIDRKTTLGRKERLLVAFVARDKFFEEHLIARAVDPAYIADYIWLAKKGSRYYDHDKERYARFVHDGIEAVVIEKAATTYIFDRGTFRGITTAD